MHFNSVGLVETEDIVVNPGHYSLLFYHNISTFSVYYVYCEVIRSSP
jgi:hypothetical protein